MTRNAAHLPQSPSPSSPLTRDGGRQSEAHSPTGKGLGRDRRAINEVETACDVSIALEAHREYGLTLKEAEAILEQARSAVREWRRQAEALGIPRGKWS